MDTKILQQIKQRYSIIGNSDGLNRALDIATQVAPTDLSVLIIGESGVGKEIIPKIIHDNSARKHNKYFAINCGSIPEGTIDSELFGHSKGAFTGAIGDREGYFGAANNGTLFLDEVGELPMATQARLLRVLETGEYIRVGESEVRKTNVRIVAATNVNMQKALREGKFREDLFYRLNTIPINLPPLRDRGMDIEMLFKKFARDICDKYKCDPIHLTEGARQLLLAYKWPGNIRQLRNLTEQLCIISKEREITEDILLDTGITNDSNGGLVIKDKQESEHSYVNEREFLFRAIASLGQDMKEIKEYIHSNMHGSPAVHKDIIPTAPVPYQPAPAYQDDNILYDNRYHILQNDGMHQQAGTQNPMAHPSYEDMGTVEPMLESPRSISDIEKVEISKALKRNNNNRQKTADELKISVRTLYRKIREYGLEI